MFNKKKEAQITVFILLAIVLIVVFSIFFLIYNNAKEQDNKLKIKLGFSSLVDQSNIKDSINLCFDTQAAKGLKLLGQQGGSLYLEQGGPIDAVAVQSLDYSGFNVTYGILRKEPGSVFYLKDVPDYPYYGKLDKTDNAYFGSDNVYGLCKPLGANDDCPSHSLAYSFEEQLRIFVKNNTKKCLEGILIQTSFPNYNITTEGEPDVKVEFGEGNVIFNLNYNISFTFADDISNGLLDFKIVKDIRLKQFHVFMKDLIDSEIRDIKFDITKDFNKLRTVKPGFTVSRVRQPCTKCSPPKRFDDVIVVSDSESLLDGKIYTFFIARANRLPALELIKQQGLELESKYDMKFKEDDEITIEPVAYDPDEEESLSISYSGWQETQSEEFKFDNVNYDEPDKSISVDKNNQPKKWTTSKLYSLAGKAPSANYSLSIKDIGNHVLRVGVKDRQGLEDYQDVRIFVQDKPVFELSGENDFISKGYKPYYASIEDPYILKASVQCIYCESKEQISKTKLEYRFYEPGKSAPYGTISSNERELSVQKEINEPFKKSPLTPFFNKGDQAELYLPDVTNYQVRYDDLKVFQCWPYLNPDSAPYPYNKIDFSKLSDADDDEWKGEDDDFYSDHACCEPVDERKDISKAKDGGWNGGKFKDSDKVCFDVEYNTCNPLFIKEQSAKDAFRSKALFDDGKGKLSSYSAIDFSVNIDTVNIQSTDPLFENSLRGSDVSDHDYLNDIFTRSFVQQCSGTRGNACAGDITEIFTYMKPCNDRDLSKGEDESCQGPSRIYTKDNCFNYFSDCIAYRVGESFEKNFLKWDGKDSGLTYQDLDGSIKNTKYDGVCNENYRYAAGDRGTYDYSKIMSDANSPYKCQAQCSANGGCSYAVNCVCALGNECDGLKYIDNFNCYDKDGDEVEVYCASCTVNDQMTDVYCNK